MNLKSCRILLTFLLTATLALAGCSGTPNTDQTAANEPGKQPAKPSGGLLGSLTSSTKPVTIPAGTTIPVRLESALSASKNNPGDSFMASVSAPVETEGKVIIPKGAMAHGKLVTAKESGRLSGVASISLELNSIEVDGKSYDIQTNTITHTSSGHAKRNTAIIGGTAAGGALIGGLAGGGKGAAIGALAGAGAGTAGAAATGKKDVSIGPETPLDFKLAGPLTIQVKQ